MGTTQGYEQHANTRPDHRTNLPSLNHPEQLRNLSPLNLKPLYRPMANNVGQLFLKLVFPSAKNTRALAAFWAAIQLIEEAAGDLEWRDDLPEAVRLLRIAADGLEATKVDQ